MESYKEIRDKLVLTYHSKDNLHGKRIDCDRTDISVHQVVMAIQRGIISFCGNRRFGKTYKGVKVVYKVDRNTGEYVVITYYRVRKNKSKKLYNFS
ncbi:hypothetical protein [Oceanobacillus sp. FSL H7-0719]|uniref:hypothetical protein n=1 Tax=Oceanobacillus sp. FSL H7-0719 TaxID=2954507 RepID=UPI003248728E